MGLNAPTEEEATEKMTRHCDSSEKLLRYNDCSSPETRWTGETKHALSSCFSVVSHAAIILLV